MNEMKLRGYKISPEWFDYNYRGKQCERANLDMNKIERIKNFKPIYPEHNKKYLKECVENLSGKGILLINNFY